MSETNLKTTSDSSNSFLANIAFGLSNMKCWDFKPPTHPLQIEQVLTICATAWGIPESDIKCKLKHTKTHDLIRQRSFLWASAIYAASRYDAAKFIGCHGGSVSASFYPISRRLRPGQDDAAYKALLDIVSECEKASRGHGKKSISEYFKPKHQYDFQTKSRTIWDINFYQYSKIAVKDINWFRKVIGTHDNEGGGILVYHSSNTKCSLILITDGNIEHLFLCQNAGYRFVIKNEFDDLKKVNPICDKCFNKNNCKKRGDDWVMSINRTLNGECFVPMTDDPLKIPIELLYPMDQYQLQ